MGTLGNLGAIDAEAGVTTRRAISELDRKLRLMNETFGRVVKNTSIVTTTAVVQYITVESTTGPQSTIKFDPTSYMTTTVDRDGNVTFQAYNEVGTPSFIFANPISFVGSGGLGDISSDTGTTPWKFTSNRGDAFAPATSGFEYVTSLPYAQFSSIHSTWKDKNGTAFMTLNVGTGPYLQINGNFHMASGAVIQPSATDLLAFWGATARTRLAHVTNFYPSGGNWNVASSTYNQILGFNAGPGDSDGDAVLTALITLIKQLQSIGLLG